MNGHLRSPRLLSILQVICPSWTEYWVASQIYLENGNNYTLRGPEIGLLVAFFPTANVDVDVDQPKIGNSGNMGHVGRVGHCFWRFMT